MKNFTDFNENDGVREVLGSGEILVGAAALIAMIWIASFGLLLNHFDLDISCFERKRVCLSMAYQAITGNIPVLRPLTDEDANLKAFKCQTCFR